MIDFITIPLFPSQLLSKLILFHASLIITVLVSWRLFLLNIELLLDHTPLFKLQ